MDRRRLAVLLVSALLMLGISAGVVGGFAAATQTIGGREWIRALVERQLARAVRGRVHLGTLRGSFIADLTLDSLELRGPDEALLLASGPVAVTFDPRDLMDGRIVIRTADVVRPQLHLRQASDGRWNLTELFPPPAGPKRVRSRTAYGSISLLPHPPVCACPGAGGRGWCPSG